MAVKLKADIKKSFLSPTNFFPIKTYIQKDFFAWKKVHSLFYSEKKWQDIILQKNQFIKQGTLNFWQFFSLFCKEKKLRKLHHDKTIK